MSSEAEAFDPFTLTDADDLFTSVVSPKKAPSPAIKTKVRSFNIKPSYDQIVDKDKSPPRVLLPKMDVKLHLHEEVSSKAVFGGKGEDGSTVEIFVEGKVAVSATFIIMVIVFSKSLFTLNYILTINETIGICSI